MNYSNSLSNLYNIIQQRQGFKDKDKDKDKVEEKKKMGYFSSRLIKIVNFKNVLE
jgi:hypothetical protein